MKKNILMFLALLCAVVTNAQEKRKLSGNVRSASDNTPLPGVNVIIRNGTYGTTTNADGNFALEVSDNDILVFSSIGYEAQEIKVTSLSQIAVLLKEDIATLNEITIVSTGYQQLPKERVNGSFVQIDNQLINRQTGTDVLGRLQDVTSGLIFNRNVPGKKNDITIRGLSTINSQAQPLIIIDNFPYDGDISNLNPNDVESITVLKDAAAASIWGARAGNGVIVITTKKGINQPMKVSFNSNVTVVNKPDLFYLPQMSSADFIANEQALFVQGFYNATESSQSLPLTPAVELMIANRNGTLSASDLNQQLAALATHDVRDDYSKYFYRKAVNQQYALSVNGGTNTHRYFVSAGWDKNSDNLVGNQYDRVTFNLNNTWTAMKERLNVNAAIYYSENNTTTNNEGTSSIRYTNLYPLYPYASFREEDGNNLSITKDYRQSFIQQSLAKGLLDWQYSPIDELSRRSNNNKLVDYRINGTASYRIIEGLNADVLYQYWKGMGQRTNLYKADSYFTRNLINQVSSISTSGIVTRPIPEGGILDLSNATTTNQSFRAQLSFNRSFGVHAISALAGYEARDQQTIAATYRTYGYNEATAVNQSVNYKTQYIRYDNAALSMFIPYVNNQSELVDRFLSSYANATYTYNKRYSISASGRRDQSNLFGVRANQRTQPLWSTGIGWTLSEESFWSLSAIPYVKIRATYGENGNINKQVTAFTTALSLGTDLTSGLPYSQIVNPANPDLRWEQVKISNVGVDFEAQDRRIYGSLEFFHKKGTDLIGTRPFSPATGVTMFTGNFAATQSNGVDIVLNTLNISNAIRWNTTLLLSTVHERVTSYDMEPIAGDLVSSGSGSTGLLIPNKGKPLYGIYSYPWAGLNPENGNPQGYLDGNISTSYAAILTATKPDNLIYHGSARPTTFGSLRNTIAWNNLSLSFNISYRLGYYFRRQSVLYNNVLQGILTHGDYASRWQQPGDEAFTNVPSMPSAMDSGRDRLYTYSEALVEKGDHIRLQDITLNYSLPSSLLQKTPFSHVEVYSNASNLGIIWKAASGNIDPDYSTMKPVRSVAFGLRLNF